MSGIFLASYYYFTFGYLVFVVSARLATVIRVRAPTYPATAAGARAARSFLLAVAVGATYLFLAFAQAALDLGQFGRSSRNLPLHLDAPLALFVQHVGPAMLVLCAWVLNTRHRRYSNAIVWLSSAWPVETYITTSRGAVLYMMLPVVLMWIASRRFTTALAAVLLCLVLVLLVRPLIGTLRIDRLTDGTSADHVSLLDFNSLTESMVQSATRVSGAYGVWRAEDHQGRFGTGR